jgi:hypothetical protein
MRKEDMDIAIKKSELIEWLSRLQDVSVLAKIDALRKASASEVYDVTMPGNSEELERKLERSGADVESGNVSSHKEVEQYFRSKFVD